jgi:hypothetical protein
MVPQKHVPQFSQPYQAVKAGIPDQGGIEGIGNQKIIPIGTEVFIFHQNFYFMGLEAAPGPRGLFDLPVPKPVFVLSRGQVCGGDKIIPVPFGRYNGNIFHCFAEF